MFTYKEARESDELANILGVCGNSAQGKSYINKGTRMLMNRGSFFGTVQPVKFCVYSSCITFPRRVGTILALNQGHSTASIWNNWYSFVPFGVGGVKSHGFGWSNGTCAGNLAVENVGTSPVFNNVPCNQNFYIRVYPSSRLDIGKKTTFFGVDINGQVVRTLRADGTIQDGEVVTATVPFGSSTIRFREITRGSKEKTQGMMRVYLYDPDNDVLHDCAAYEPTETSPDYRVVRVRGLHCTKCPDGLKSVSSLVKLAFIPVEHDDDLVLIDNLDALAMMIQAIRNREADKLDAAKEQEVAAIHELNLETNVKFPVEQTPISINPFGNSLPRNHGVGRII